MIIDLEETTASKVTSALVQARRAAGSPAMGMVLTLVIVTDEDGIEDAMRAAGDAAREHPSRILGVVAPDDDSRGPARLDASVSIGEGLSGESVVLRMSGELVAHADSVVTPLLLPESPVVVWWPASAPDVPSKDPIGALAQRRVTDASASPDPEAQLARFCAGYTPGDTDLTWTRTTPWRALLAAALDQHPARIGEAIVEAEKSNASADLIAAWLGWRLRIPVSVQSSEGPGITACRLRTADGEIAITRPDGVLARYEIPGQPERHVALKRRETYELLAEELRRLDPDDVYASTVHEMVRDRTTMTTPRAKPKPTKPAKTGVKGGSTSKPAAKASKPKAAKATARKRSESS